MTEPIPLNMEAKFASGFVRFTRDPLVELQDVHVVLARVQDGNYAILVKPRALAFVVGEAHVYRAWIDPAWSFKCMEDKQTVYCLDFRRSVWLQFQFAHKDEFWRFVRRFAEARCHSSRRNSLTEARMSQLQSGFRSFCQRGEELGWDTFHSGVKRA